MARYRNAPIEPAISDYVEVDSSNGLAYAFGLAERVAHVTRVGRSGLRLRFDDRELVVADVPPGICNIIAAAPPRRQRVRSRTTALSEGSRSRMSSRLAAGQSVGIE
jgi:hypothetical protein